MHPKKAKLQSLNVKGEKWTNTKLIKMLVYAYSVRKYCLSKQLFSLVHKCEIYIVALICLHDTVMWTKIYWIYNI